MREQAPLRQLELVQGSLPWRLLEGVWLRPRQLVLVQGCLPRRLVWVQRQPLLVPPVQEQERQQQQQGVSLVSTGQAPVRLRQRRGLPQLRLGRHRARPGRRRPADAPVPAAAQVPAAVREPAAARMLAAVRALPAAAPLPAAGQTPSRGYPERAPVWHLLQLQERLLCSRRGHLQGLLRTQEQLAH